MKVDRSLFLILTGSLAGAACQVYVDEPPKTGSNATPPPTANQSNQSTPTAQPATTAAPHIVHLKPRTSGGAVTPPGPQPPTPQSCLDNGQATVGDCGQMQAPDSSCAPFPFPQSRCNVYKQFFDAKTAAAAVKCEIGLSAKQVCDGMQSYNCGKAALLQACPDPQVTQFCQGAVTPCQTTASDCAAMVSGLNDQGQQQVAMCVAKGCQGGLYSCVEGLSAGGGGNGPPPPTPPPAPSGEGARRLH
jgi:hypothetical protein